MQSTIISIAFNTIIILSTNNSFNESFRQGGRDEVECVLLEHIISRVRSPYLSSVATAEVPLTGTRSITLKAVGLSKYHLL